MGLEAKKMGFRDALLHAAREGRLSGKITARQYARIWLASLIPANVDKLQSAVAHEAIAEKCGAVGDPSAWDWTALIAMIEKLLPLILQLISLFAL